MKIDKYCTLKVLITFCWLSFLNPFWIIHACQQTLISILICLLLLLDYLLGFLFLCTHISFLFLIRIHLYTHTVCIVLFICLHTKWYRIGNIYIGMYTLESSFHHEVLIIAYFRYKHAYIWTICVTFHS